ncbi:hypothetical protein [Massilia sp. METH4]|uniref:hypothetical protein n=1 Tax=Massilia sp. METH4 TaxID=3123041 RepID=UPI0030D4514A
MVLDVAVAEAPVDEACRQVMERLKSAGCVVADMPYSVEPFQVAETDLRYLLNHGEVHQPGSALVVPVLRSVSVERKGADVGKISFVLGVNLV